MRKPTKSFTVEVKRRPGATKKNQPFPTAPVETAAPPGAASVFRAPGPAPEAEPERRILPCLVTEAALDAATAISLDAPAAPRKRGRPRKERHSEDAAPAAPRKRGRPRKTATTPPFDWANFVEAEPAPQPVRRPIAAPAVLTTISDRTAARRRAVLELPRGERWKRRLPKALR